MIPKTIKMTLKAFCFAVTYHDNFIQPYPLLGGNHYCESGSNKLVVIEESNYEEYVQKSLDRVLEHSKRVDDILVMMSNPYRLQFLHFIRKELTPKHIGRLLSWCWTQTEFPCQHGTRLMTELFKMADTRSLMQSDEYKVYESLKDPITIYRGLQSEDARVRGISWTLDEEKAKWFAKRWNASNGIYYRAVIHKRNVFAYFNGRKEEELVVNPRCLASVTEMKGVRT